MKYRLWYSASHDAQQAKVAKDIIARGEGRWAMTKRQTAQALKPHYRMVRVTAKFLVPESHIGGTPRSDLIRQGVRIDSYERQRQIDSLERQESDYKRWHKDAVFVGEGEVFSEERFFEDYPDPFVPWEPDREKEKLAEEARRLAALPVPKVEDLATRPERPEPDELPSAKSRRFRLDVED